MTENAKDREIGEAWETFNAAFRQGYRDAMRNLPNVGKVMGTPWERGVHHGWEWQNCGRAMPNDPMRAMLKRGVGVDPFSLVDPEVQP